MLHLTIPFLIGLLVPMHTRLARSEPAMEGIVASAPRELRLWFEGGVEAGFTKVSLHGSAGARMALGAPAGGDEPGLIVVPVPMSLRPDQYTVSWETVGRDGHVIRGSFSFGLAGADGAVPAAEAPVTVDSTAWGAGAAGRTVTGSAVEPEPGAGGTSTRSPAQFSRASRPVRWVEITTLVTSLGAVALLLGVLRTGRGSPAHEHFIGDATRRVSVLGVAAVTLFLFSTVARFGLESQSLHGGMGGWSAEGLARTAATGWGRAWVIAAIAMTVLLVALVHRMMLSRRVPASRAGAGSDVALGVAALAAAVGPAMTGHAAAAASLMPLAVLADWLHVIGASAWVGGVTGLALAAAPAALAQPAGDRAPALAWLVRAFHALATPAIALVALSGIVSGWLRVGTWSDLVTSNYGDLLLFKVYLVAFTALLGAYHWFRVHPRLVSAAAGDERTARHLQWTLAVEVGVSLLVVALTAALVTTPPPR